MREGREGREVYEGGEVYVWVKRYETMALWYSYLDIWSGLHKNRTAVGRTDGRATTRTRASCIGTRARGRGGGGGHVLGVGWFPALVHSK